MVPRIKLFSKRCTVPYKVIFFGLQTQRLRLRVANYMPTANYNLIAAIIAQIPNEIVLPNAYVAHGVLY